MKDRLDLNHTPTIFFSVGEPSGDLHGANLIRELQKRVPGIRCIGYGGPQMRGAGCVLMYDLTSLAVMWLLRVIAHLPVFYRLYRQARHVFETQRPDAVVLIDYPGFNWWIARAAKRAGVPVYYYVPPQIWAWASWRVHKMRRLVDHVLCSLPFEEPWFRQNGCRATFVGHPFFDETGRQQFDTTFLELHRAQRRPLVVLLPGSRTQEVQHNLPSFLAAARRVQARLPDAEFVIAAFKESQAELARNMVRQFNLPIEVHVGRTPELMKLATCALACSGSVSLELLYHQVPTAILYQVNPLAYLIGRTLINVPYCTLVNLLTVATIRQRWAKPFDPLAPGADLVPMPEYVAYDDKSEQLAAHVVEWLTQPERRRQKVEQLGELKQRVCHGGASRRAAEYLFRTLAQSQIGTATDRVLTPHYDSALKSRLG